MPSLQGAPFPKPKLAARTQTTPDLLPSKVHVKGPEPGSVALIMPPFLPKASRKGNQGPMELQLCQGDPHRVTVLRTKEGG